MRIDEATWPEIRDLDTDLAVVPVGSTEQHGPHAPLGTDALTAAAVAKAGVETYDDPVAVAPPVAVGVSEEHRHFAGTLWVSPDTFRAYVRETAESLAAHGFERVVFVNGHGGNTDALREVAASLSRSGDAYAVAFTWFDGVGEHAGDMGHGGPVETSVVWHAHPELIREERLDDARDGAGEGWGEWVSHVNLAHDTAEFTENGVVGDPSAADAERGADLLDVAGEALARLLGAVADRDLTPPTRR